MNVIRCMAVFYNSVDFCIFFNLFWRIAIKQFDIVAHILCNIDMYISIYNTIYVVAYECNLKNCDTNQQISPIDVLHVYKFHLTLYPTRLPQSDLQLNRNCLLEISLNRTVNILRCSKIKNFLASYNLFSAIQEKNIFFVMRILVCLCVQLWPYFM